MKPLNQYIKEKLIINKDYKDYRNNMIVVKSFDELRNIIEYRYDKLGPGTEQNPIDFNDIDVSHLDSFCKGLGLFEGPKFKYVDISDWDVSNVKSMHRMFSMCKELKSVGDISSWDVSKVTNMGSMFFKCEKLESVGDISKWNVSNVTNMHCMFGGCESFNQGLSNWDVSNVTNMRFMFYECKSFNQDISRWDVSKVRQYAYMFDKCPIKSEYKPKI